MKIKIGDMIKSDTGACGIIVSCSSESSEITINWNKSHMKEIDIDKSTFDLLIDYKKWEVVPDEV